jgi:hypothetical protein
MDAARGKVVRRGTDAKGRARKAVEVPYTHYDDFEFGEIVRIEKLKKDETQQES